MNSKVKSMMQHYGNCLHLYCRLRPIFGNRVAMAISRSWELCFIYRFLYA